MRRAGGASSFVGGRPARPALAAALAALFLVVGPALAAAAAASQSTTPAPTAGDAEAGFVSRVAAERRAHGRAALAVVEELAAVARRHSAAMAADNRVYHNPSLAEQVQNWQLVGENVGAGTSVDDVHAALMASQRHRDVLLNPRFTELGVGVVMSNGKLWVSQVFRQPTGDTGQASAESAPPTSPPPSAAPPTSPPPDAAPAPAPGPRPATVAPATALSPAAEVRVPAMARAPAPVAAPAPTAPTPAAFVPDPAEPTELAIEARPAAASAPLPLPPELPAAGVLAAFLLWSVVAGLTGVVGRLQPLRAF